MTLSKQQFYLPTLVLAAGLFVYGAYTGAPHDAFTRTQSMLAAATVGTSAAVAPNPYNTWNQQLTEKEKALALREKTIAALEAKFSGSNPAVPQSNLPLYSFGMSIFLAVLVGLNFYFDWRRSAVQDSPLFSGVINLRRG
jgi:hypothetical protein